MYITYTSRMMKCRRALRYHDAIHEYLAYPDGRPVPTARILSKDFLLLHRGYAPERRAAKMTRNIALLEKIEREGGEKQYLHYYLSGLYLDAGRWEDACREAETSLKMGEHPKMLGLARLRRFSTRAMFSSVIFATSSSRVTRFFLMSS